MQPQAIRDEAFTNSIIKPALRAGAFGGTFGLIIGSISGQLRSKTPVLFAIASGIQCATVGSTFWLTRSALLNAKTFHSDPSSAPDSSTFLKASTVAGALTGSSLGLLFRGPRNVIPGAIVFSLFGWSGQQIYNVLDQRHTVEVDAENERARLFREGGVVQPRTWRGFMDYVADMKWSPIKKLSDDEYEAMLQEKLVGVEADIALIDEEIERVKRLAVEDEQAKKVD